MKVYDFTAVCGPEMTSCYPGHSAPKVERWATYEKDGYEARLLTIDSHVGTHVDAPKHFVPGGKGADQIPIDRLVGEGVVLDIPKGPYEEISAKDLEIAQPSVQKGDIVFIHCGWGDKWHSPWDEEAFRSRPGLDATGAQWLVSKKVKAVGIDSLTIQVGKEEVTPGSPTVHGILLENEVVIVECLVNLDAIKGQRAIIAIGLVSVKGADGGQARVLGIQL